MSKEDRLFYDYHRRLMRALEIATCEHGWNLWMEDGAYKVAENSREDADYVFFSHGDSDSQLELEDLEVQLRIKRKKKSYIV